MVTIELCLFSCILFCIFCLTLFNYWRKGCWSISLRQKELLELCYEIAGFSMFLQLLTPNQKDFAFTGTSAWNTSIQFTWNKFWHWLFSSPRSRPLRRKSDICWKRRRRVAFRQYWGGKTLIFFKGDLQQISTGSSRPATAPLLHKFLHFCSLQELHGITGLVSTA